MTGKLALAGARHSRSLSGAEKVGVLLLALGQEKASELLKKMDAEELNIIMRSADMMAPASASELETIISEFEGRLEAGVQFVGKPDDIKQIVAQVITENRSAADAERGGAPTKEFWPRMSDLENDVLVPYLAKQHPQIAAFVLYRLGSERSASLLKIFDAPTRNELVGRLLGIKDVSSLVVETIEQAIASELFESDEGASVQRTAMASILSNFDYSQTNEVLDHIAGFRPKDAAAIKKMIFKFTDLDKLPPKALTAIMDGVPVERIVVSLAGMQDVFIATVLATLSPRARRMAEAELRNGVNPSPADLATSRRAIVEAVLKLVADGTLDLSTIVTPEPPPV